MGSPIIGGAQFTAYARFYKMMGYDLNGIADILQKREETPLTVPSHVMYSKKDGIVYWEACIDPYNAHTTHQEIQTPHFSMGTSLETYDELFRWFTTILPTTQS